MRTLVAVLAVLIMASSAASAVRANLRPLELAAAINKADAQLVPYRVTAVRAVDIRAVHCIAPDEEPTELQCEWQHRIKRRWIKRTTWLTIDENGWRVMDA